jgi:hypothetical protein
MFPALSMVSHVFPADPGRITVRRAFTTRAEDQRTNIFPPLQVAASTTPRFTVMPASSLVFYLAVAATLSVAAVLVWGLSTMLRGGNANLSQKLMRWRVGLQFIAILVIMLFVYLTRGFA